MCLASLLKSNAVPSLAQARCDGTPRLQQVAQAWDWLDSSATKLNLCMHYNSTDRFDSDGTSPPQIIRLNQV